MSAWRPPVRELIRKLPPRPFAAIRTVVPIDHWDVDVVCQREVDVYVEVVEEGVQICVQGDVADMFYLIMSGSCNVLFNGESIATLTELQVFGESALFPNGVGRVATRGATVETVRGGGNVQLLRLSKKKFDTLLSSGTLTKECVRKIEVVAKERESANRLKVKTASSRGSVVEI